MKIIYKDGQEDVFECQYNVDYERRIVELITGRVDVEIKIHLFPFFFSHYIMYIFR